MKKISDNKRPLINFLTVMLLAVLPIQALAANLCSEVFSRQSSLSGAQFLNSRNQNLHTSPAVERDAKRYARETGDKSLSTKPAQKIENWLQYLERRTNAVKQDARNIERMKQVFINKYVIKAEDIPQAYFELQIRIAREQGHGDIALTSQQKQNMARTIINDQQKSLEVWMDYFLSSDSSMYPMWTKYWTFTNMVKLGKLDSEKGTFGNRDRSTTAPFPELNREALAVVIDAIVRKVEKKSLAEVTDEGLVSLLEGANFGKLYGRTVKTLREQRLAADAQFGTVRGQWVKYPRNSDHRPLVASLEGKGTGWCTAGHATAAQQLKAGDFHVFYSLDNQGKPTVPRVAIRMEGDAIGEVRGVSEHQNLDPQIAKSDIVNDKMKSFGEAGEKYQFASADMKRLTQIENALKHSAELSKEDILFLYEFDRKIMSFGYRKDPRISEILSKRDKTLDLAIAFDVRPDQISTSPSALSNQNVRVNFGGIVVTKEDIQAGFREFPEIVIGDILITAYSIYGTTLPKVVKGSLTIRSKDLAGMSMPEHVAENVFFHNLENADGTRLPKFIGGNLEMFNVRSAQGIIFPEAMGTESWIAMPDVSPSEIKSRPKHLKFL